MKATDENSCPPGEAEKLASECQAAAKDRSKLSRALSVMALLAKEPPVKAAMIGILKQMRDAGLPRMTICPVIVRGITRGHHDDMKPVRAAAPQCQPAILHGLVVSIGVDLVEFGRKVMELARKAA